VFDSIFEVVSLVIIGLASGFFFHRRGLRYLQYLQQEDYEGERFWKWCQNKQAFDRRGTAAAAVAGILTGSIAGLSVRGGCLAGALCAVLLVYRALHEEDPRQDAKVKLRLTERAQRIFGYAESLNALVLLLLIPIAFSFGRLALPFYWFIQVMVFQFHPLFLILAKVLLDPGEKQLQEGFANEARKKIAEVKPITIGITGSYGKTSTKVILNEILGAVAPTFTTPRSINSYMGVTREIRERMKDYHRYAIIEMGAYYIGSIRRMCTLTPPTVAIVTAVGEMHLDRFGSPENVFKAKSELAQSVPADGILICNGDYDYCRKMAADNKKKTTLLYGFDESKGPLDAVMFDVKTTEQGSTFKIRYGGKQYEGFTKLLSKPLLSNVLGAFTLAMALGLSPEIVLAAIRNVKTESNRLEPVRTNLSGLAPITNGANGKSTSEQILRLNDAFNSNPIGFKAALDVLGEIPGKRKILVTPGMVELADRQAVENEAAAKRAAAVCDFVVVVGETNKDPLLKGLKDGGLPSEKIEWKASMKEALGHLASQYCSEGDVVLIENDLPDIYEATPKF
jgi:UDP-N-acetylmuramoyl-tripeptide--D-alanyl-D-alanine ligase